MRPPLVVVWGLLAAILIALRCSSRALKASSRIAAAPRTAVLIAEAGLRSEHHVVSTLDGYDIGLTRVLPSTQPAKRTALIIHGLADSSSTFVLSGHHSLVYFLNTRGYDVWLVDGRGRGASFIEATDAVRSREWWQWTLDHVVDFDIPHAVEYVLKETHKSRIDVGIGHSQGGLALLASAAAHDLKITKLVALAPPLGGWSSHRYIPLLSSATLHALLGDPADVARAARTVASFTCAHFESACRYLLCMTAGCADPRDLGVSTSKIFSYYPAATSWANIEHLMQCERVGYACYGRGYEDVYDFASISHKSALAYGTNDGVVDFQSRAEASRLLLNPAYYVVVEGYGHGDFIWAKSATARLYIPLFKEFVEA